MLFNQKKEFSKSQTGGSKGHVKEANRTRHEKTITKCLPEESEIVKSLSDQDQRSGWWLPRCGARAEEEALNGRTSASVRRH